MLEDTKATLQDLEKVTVLFRPLENECLVPSMIAHTLTVHVLILVPIEMRSTVYL